MSVQESKGQDGRFMTPVVVRHAMHSMRSGFSNADRQFPDYAPTGLGFSPPTPGLPWAIVGRPVGASERWIGYVIRRDGTGVGFSSFWGGEWWAGDGVRNPGASGFDMAIRQFVLSAQGTPGQKINPAEAPTGRNGIAQGRAKHHPGLAPQKNQAPTGRNNLWHL